MSNTTKLEQFNTFRAMDNLAPIAAWRPARHEPMLREYEAIVAAANAAEDAANAAIAAAAPVATGQRERGTIEKPIAYVWAAVQAAPELGRKALIDWCVAAGVHKTTASIQVGKAYRAHRPIV